MKKTLLQIDSLEKAYDQSPVLNSVSLSLEAGEHTGLVGNNGQGKTTLIKLILGLLRPDGGTIRLNGVEVGFPRTAQEKKQMGYLPESVSFYPHLTGRNTLRFMAGLKQADTSMVDPLLEQVGLSDAADNAVGTYSKGMRQRLGLAQALLGNPGILLLDEPSSGLDPGGTREFYTILEHLQRKNVAILTASHRLAEIEARLDKILLLQDGHFLKQGPIRELVAQAGLPVQIRVVLKSAEKGILALLNKMNAVQTPNGHAQTFEVECADAEKMSVLETLLAHKKEVAALSVKEPGLEEVVHHFQSSHSGQEDAS